MKRYLLFAGESYYPVGGWKDFVDSYDTIEEAVSYGRAAGDWWHVVDSATGKIVEKY